MAITSVAAFLTLLRQLNLLEPAQLDELAGDPLSRSAVLRDVARELIRRGWVTPYQVNQLLQGRGADLLLGQYVLLERLGQGGMGQVYKARHRHLNRIVALKIIRKDRLTSADSFRRFAREIRAVGQVSHPNIILAFDADQVGGTHYFAMEYVEGTDLARVVKQGGSLPVRQACDYVRQAAVGLQHAHEHGLVHRDIKPANLLRTADGRHIKILDLGLARLNQTAESEDSPSGLTHTGTVLGTPDYIAPEQITDSRSADIRADLYSLGGTFYFLLTARPPFPGGTVIEKLAKHQWGEPEALEDLRPEVPSAVAAIVRKLMAKSPHDRYQTPSELADVLRGVLVGGFQPAAEKGTGPGRTEPAASAREARALPDAPGSVPRGPFSPPEAGAGEGVAVGMQPAPLSPATPPDSGGGESGVTPVATEAGAETNPPWPALAASPAAAEVPSRYQLRRSSQKARWIIPLAAGISLTVLGCLALAAILLLQKRESAGPDQARVSPQGGPGGAVREDKGAAPISGRSGSRPRTSARAPAEDPAHLEPALPPVVHVKVDANKPWQDTHMDVQAGKQVLLRARGDWKLRETACRADGLAAAPRDRTVWPDAPAMCLLARIDGDPTPIVVGRSFTLQPGRDGRLFVQANDLDLEQNSGTLDLDIDGGTYQTATAPAPGPTWVEAAEAALKPLAARAADGAADPDGLRREVIAFQIRFAGTPQALRAAQVLARLPSPLDRLVRTQIPSRETFNWHPPELVAVLGEHRWWHGHSLRCLALSPDGKTIATGGDDGFIRLWDVKTGKDRPTRAVLKHKGPVSALAFFPDGKTLASGGAEDAIVRLWDVATGRKRGEHPHVNPVLCLAISPDGHFLAAGCQQKVVKLWEIPGGREISFEAHPGTIRTVAFAPDSRAGFPRDYTLVTGGDDRTAKVWFIQVQKEKIIVDGRLVNRIARVERLTLSLHTGEVLSAAFSPDGKLLATGSADGSAKVWDVGTGKQQASLPGHRGAAGAVAFAGGSSVLATGDWEGMVRFWDVATGDKRTIFMAHPGGVSVLTFGSGGKLLFTGGGDGTVRLWDPAGEKEWAPRSNHRVSVASVALSPDGRTVAAASLDHTITLWDVATRKERQTLTGHTGGVTAVAFSSDGKALATGSEDGTVRLWDPDTGEKRGALPGHPGGVTAVAFAPDGRTLASAGNDNLVTVWDLATLKERHKLAGHAQTVTSVAFAPGGKLLASGGQGGGIRLWEAETGQDRGLIAAQPRVTCVAFAPDGRTVASAGSSDLPVRLWSVDSRGEVANLPQSKQDTPVACVAFAPDGKTYLAASADGQLGLWDTGPGQKDRSLWGCRLVGTVTSIAFAADGRHVATASANGTVYILRLPPLPGAPR
jgi:WD40 repeat protein/tRNA A-37 threonylcarbamoyl transferase component Bud32